MQAATLIHSCAEAEHAGTLLISNIVQQAILDGECTSENTEGMLVEVCTTRHANLQLNIANNTQQNLRKGPATMQLHLPHMQTCR